MKRAALVLTSLVIPATVTLAQSGDNYRCTYGDLVRRVEIVYETGVAVPCEVHYYKDSEAPGERQVLWQAFNESGYCESRSRDFVTRLESMGWSCDAAAAAGAPREAPQDDTDVLGAAESEN